jgi:hypothetical protein
MIEAMEACSIAWTASSWPRQSSFHMTRHWFTMEHGAASQHAETIEDVLQLGAAQELVARGVLAADLLEGPR